MNGKLAKEENLGDGREPRTRTLSSLSAVAPLKIIKYLSLEKCLFQFILLGNLSF